MAATYQIKNRFMNVVETGVVKNLNKLISKFRKSSLFKLEIKEGNNIVELYNF